MKILVAYASTHGSTQEIAEAVAAALREQGLVVDLQQLKNVQSLQGYDAVVLGAPLYIFHLHKDALRFLARHRSTLTSGIPIAIFSGGPFGPGDGNDWQEVRKNLDTELAKFPWLTPVSVEIVGGKFDPAKLRFPWNLLPAMRQMPYSDLRDWETIRGWAGSLAVLFAGQNQDAQAVKP